MSVLETLISQDFTIEGKDNSRWAKTAEHDSLVIDREKEVFYWNSKNIAGDALVYLTKVRGLSFPEARNIIAEYKIYSDTYVYTIKSQDGEEDVVVYPKLVELFWEEGKNNRDYWHRRLLSNNIIDRFQLGFHDGFYTIPIFMDGTIRNFQCRRDDPKLIRSWYRGFGPLLFNSDILKVVDNIIITEGTVDAILLNQLGFPAISTNSGSQWQDKLWYHKFVYQKDIVVVCDNDRPGIKFGKQIAESLGTTRVRLATFDNYPLKYDTIEFFREGGELEEFKEIIYNAQYIYDFGGDFSPKVTY